MIEFLLLFLTELSLAACMLLQPTSIVAPRGWYVQGGEPGRPAGEVRVTRVPERGTCDGREGCRDQRPDPFVRARLYCTGGARVIIVDGRAAGCQR